MSRTKPKPGESQPWERQPEETSKSFAAFQMYRNMGPERSYDKVRDALGKSPGYSILLQRWGSRYNWVERSRLYDNFQDQLEQQSKKEYRDKEIREMEREHIDMIKATRRGLMAPIQALNKKLSEELRENDGRIVSFDTKSTEQLIELINKYLRSIPDLIKVERLVNGLSADFIETHTTGEVEHSGFIESGLTKEEIAELRFILRARLNSARTINGSGQEAEIAAIPSESSH